MEHTTDSAHPELVALEPLTRAPEELWSRLRSALRAAKFDDSVLATSELILQTQVEAVRTPLVRWNLLERDEPGATLAVLFLYGGCVEQPRLEPLLGRELLEDLIELDVLRRRDAGLEARMRLTPFDGVWLLSDLLTHDGERVMGPGVTTAILRECLPALAGRTLVDIGCGAGSLAIWAAARGARVTATDLDPRSVALTEINARLNAVECEALRGDLGEPVAERRFDLLVAQPPFIMQPEAIDAVTFMHGGASGSELVLRLMQQVEGLLTPAGRALVLFEAPVEAEPLLDKLMAEVRPRGPMAARLSVGGYTSPDALASTYALLSCGAPSRDYAAAATHYRAHMAARGVERIAHLLVELERLGSADEAYSATTSWSSLARLDAAHLDAMRRNLALLRAGPEALLHARLQLNAGARLRSEQRVDASTPPQLTLTFANSPVQDQRLDEDAISVVYAITTHGSIAAACTQLAPPDEDPRGLHAPVLDLARRLLLHAVLVVETDAA